MWDFTSPIKDWPDTSCIGKGGLSHWTGEVPIVMMKAASVSSSVVPHSLQPHGLQPTRLPCPWGFPGKDTGVGGHFLLQGIFPTQGSNLDLLHCRQILYHLSYEGSPLSRPSETIKLYFCFCRVEGNYMWHNATSVLCTVWLNECLHSLPTFLQRKQWFYFLAIRKSLFLGWLKFPGTPPQPWGQSHPHADAQDLGWCSSVAPPAQPKTSVFTIVGGQKQRELPPALGCLAPEVTYVTSTKACWPELATWPCIVAKLYFPYALRKRKMETRF